MPEDNDLAISFIQRLTREEFWGNIVLRLQHGRIIHITKEESIKPIQTSPGYRRNYEERTHN